MEKITYFLARLLVESVESDEEQLEIYQYGFFLLIEQIVGLGVPALLCLAAGWGKEYLLFLGVFMTVRTISGGFHMKTYIQCFVGSFLFILGLMFTRNYKAIQIIVETLTANFVFVMLGKREYEKEVFA